MNRKVTIIISILLLMGVRLSASDQEVTAPRRTAEERAMKQTEMLVRELDIRDSLLRDTLFRVHLRYAHKRSKAGSRSEAVDCINQLMAELKVILTAEQYERLQSIPRRQGARVHHSETDSLVRVATPATR